MNVQEMVYVQMECVNVMMVGEVNFVKKDMSRMVFVEKEYVNAMMDGQGLLVMSKFVERIV
jgi:trehalose-6-phosphate synthase